MKFQGGILTVSLLLLLTGCGQNPNPTPPSATTPTQETTPEATEQPSPETTEQPTPETTTPPTPEVTEQPTPQVQSRELARYGSDMTSHKENRIHNIRLAIQKVNGYVMQSGETISFNEIVGPTTPENGFAKATVYIDGQETEDYGGGICQLSSTLYNAAMEAELEIIERHPHQGGTVHYVPEGRDATVSYGGVDLKIKNTKPFPVKIFASMDKNGVYVALKSIETVQ